MKTTLSLILIILLSSCTTFKMVSSQKTGEIIEVPGVKKDEIYIKANQWMVRIFKDAKSVIQFQDKAEGKIIGKFLLKSMGSPGGGYGLYSMPSTMVDIYCLITISIKDNATKIDVEPMGDWKYDPSGFTIYNYSPEDADIDMKAITDNYKKVILTKEDIWKN